jgi:hypothetical protein
MASFDDRLRRVLSEMPVRHFKAAGRTFQPGDRRSGFDTYDDDVDDPYGLKGKNRSYAGYVAPKYMEVLSDKLSRLSGYNINIFIIDGRLNDIYRTELSELTGVPVNELKDAINFIMAGNNAQRQFSPWLYMHQLGEALNNACRIDDPSFGRHEEAGAKFMEFYAGIAKLVPDWEHRLKMGSAREAKEKGSIIGDFHQELITEFLWHGGRIRFDYPDGVARRDVDALFDLFKSALRQLLDACVGDVLVNDQMND